MTLETSEPDIQLIDLDGGRVYLGDGTVLPITNMFDIDGDECDADDVVSIVAGMGDIWISCEVEATPVTFH